MQHSKRVALLSDDLSLKGNSTIMLQRSNQRKQSGMFKGAFLSNASNFNSTQELRREKNNSNMDASVVERFNEDLFNCF